MKNRFVIALTLLALLAVVCVGCSEENADAADTPTDNTQAAPNEPAATDKPAEDPAAEPADEPTTEPADEPVSDADQAYDARLALLQEHLDIGAADAAKLVKFCELRKQVPDANVQIVMTYQVTLDNGTENSVAIAD